MRPVTVRLTAAGFSPWIPLNWRRKNFEVALGVKLSSNANLTYSVQHTMDPLLLEETQEFSIARVATTATVTKTNHGVSVGDWVMVRDCGAPFDGEFSVAAITDQDNFTYTVANSGATAVARGKGWLKTARVFPHSTLAAKTASADGNYDFPPMACRLLISAFVAGYADLTVIST